jgi:hypothetical protein
LKKTADRPAASASVEARLAREIARTLRPKTVLDASGSDAFLSELRSNGMQAAAFNPATPPAVSERFDLATCVPGPAAFTLDTTAELARFARRILFIPPQEGNTPVVAWLTNFSACGFAPDAEFDTSPLHADAVLLKRGPAWPPDALRAFTGWMHLRNPVQRLAEIEAELSEQRRRLTLALNEPVQQDDGAAGLRISAGLNPFERPKPAARAGTAEADPETDRRLETLERSVAELGRACEALNRRIEDILLSRTWKALTAMGAIPLRLLGRG